MDVTMCKGEGCLLRKNCWRYIGPAQPQYQSYFVVPPIQDKKCDYYWHCEYDETGRAYPTGKGVTR